MHHLHPIRAIALTLIAVLLLLPAFSTPRQNKAPSAQSSTTGKHRIDVFLDGCMEKNPSTHGMLNCLRQAHQMWDGEMNTVYKNLMTKLPMKGQADLKASQRAWIAFRDREYKFMDTMFGQMDGTMYLPMHADAGMRLTKERALQLNSLLKTYKIDKP